MSEETTRNEKIDTKHSTALLNKLDLLFEEYLQLLDEYKSLRDRLEASFAKGFMDLAKANFSTTNRMRYGQDYYDQRMQALRTVDMETSDAGELRFSLALTTSDSKSNGDSADLEKQANSKESKVDEANGNTPENSTEKGEKESSSKEKQQQNTDPIRWFGIMVPQPLRSAQRHFVDVVEGQVAQLASVDNRMKGVEIEIRRTKKYLTRTRAKSKPESK